MYCVRLDGLHQPQHAVARSELRFFQRKDAVAGTTTRFPLTVRYNFANGFVGVTVSVNFPLRRKSVGGNGLQFLFWLDFVRFVGTVSQDVQVVTKSPLNHAAASEDGTLHQLDNLDGKILKSAKVTEPYSMDGHWNDPRPRIAMAGDDIVMTDPNAGLVRRISKIELKEVGAIKVDGKPYNIAVAGGSGKVHEHAHSHGDPKIYAGYFEDSQIKDRPLADYAGDWQSVYPYLTDGSLDSVWTHKAEKGTSTAEEIRAEYEVGYKTDVNRITIDGDAVTFFKDGQPSKGTYAYEGREILTYKKGNRGVRFIFKKTDGDATAPQYIQFSDHGIAPNKADHYHLSG